MTMLSDIQINSLKENGYLVVKKAFFYELNTLISECRAVFTRQAETYGINLNTVEADDPIFKLWDIDKEVVKNCGKILQLLPSIHKLSTESTIYWKVEKVIKKPVICTRPVVFFHNKRLAESESYYKTPVHRDFYSTQGSLNSLVVWVPLVNITQDIGPLEVVPGSHNHEFKFGGFQNSFGLELGYDDDDFISLPVEKGDIVLFSTLLVHRSGNNITDNKIRWSVSYRFNDLEDVDWKQRKYFSPYQYKPMVDKPYTPAGILS